jgi:hypothetical protein
VRNNSGGDDERDSEEEEKMMSKSTMFGNLNRKNVSPTKGEKHSLRRDSDDIENYIEYEQRKAPEILLSSILNSKSDDCRKMWQMINAYKKHGE